MKKILILLIFITLFCCGCDVPFILMKSTPFTKENSDSYEQSFNVGQRVYFAVVTPKKFKDDTLRIQIIKKDEKTYAFGYSLAYSRDIHIDNTLKYCTDYFVLHQKGYYFMQVFELQNTATPIARYDFWIK